MTHSLRREGTACLDGWSDDGSWRIVLPWPAEVRALPWASAEKWRSFVAGLEADLPRIATSEGLPFSGGWVGYLSYEAGATVECAPPWTELPPEPAAWFALHLSGVLVGPGGESYLFAPAGESERRIRDLEALDAGLEGQTRLTGPLMDSLGGGAYENRVERIRRGIRDGDVYQVNLTRAWSRSGHADAPSLYSSLTGSAPPRSSAFLRGKGWAIASASPEVLLDLDRRTGIAETKPIKGTVRRNGDDTAEIEALLASEKDAAEHLMIVDVSRNDLGKIAPAGSVSVPDYRSVRTLTHVHHLESTVRAEGVGGVPLPDLLAALCPAASITGAPKRAAVHLIRELETVPRGVYCGAIGMLRPDGAALSVAIRTGVVSGSEVRYHAGGGIVWDSEGAAEDDECRAKSAAFLEFAGGGEA